MAEVYPLKEIPRNDGGCSIVEFTNDDYMGVSALPNVLPDDWSEFADGHTFTSGDQVWYLGRLYSCDAQHNKTSTNNPDATGNWQFVGGQLTVLSGSAGQDPISNVTQLEFSLNINSSLSGSNISLQPNASGDRADYTFNLDPDDFVSSQTPPALDYNQPETLIRVLTEAQNKEPVFGTDGLPISAAVTVTNANGTGRTAYFVEYTFSQGLPEIIRYYEGIDNTGTLRAVKRLTFNAAGLPSEITIGAT